MTIWPEPDPWCQEADGEYVPPAEPEVVTADVTEMYDRWNDTLKGGTDA